MRLAELARRSGLADHDMSDEAAAQRLIQRIVELRGEMDMKVSAEGLEESDIPGIVKAAIRETGDLYPVPRYLSADQLALIARGLLETSRQEVT